MIELFLDGMPAVVNKNINIKLTVENVYFTKSSSYTYDVDLPIDIPANRRIFGNIERLDTDKHPRTLDARLVVDNSTITIGIAHITQVTDKTVKVQILGESAAYNYRNKLDKLYIDELDMGDWYMETWPDGSFVSPGINGQQPIWVYNLAPRQGNAGCILGRARYKGPAFGYDEYTEQELMRLIYSGDLGWVAYPTYNEEAETRHNAIAYKEDVAYSNIFTPFIRDYEGERTGGRKYEDAILMTPSFSVQPFVWKIAELVARGTGYSLPKGDNVLYSDTFFRRIFIVSTSTSVLINKGLPHWSVNDFWSNIEQTFGVIVKIDYESKCVKIAKRRDHYSLANTIALNNIVSDHEATIDDETETDISVNNVGFPDGELNPEDFLSEDISDNATYMSFASEMEIISWCASQEDMSGYKDVIFICGNGRQYIYSADVGGEPGIVEVNMLRPRIVREDKEDIEIELKIVPARYSKQDADIFTRRPDETNHAVRVRDIPDGSFQVSMLQVPGNHVPNIFEDEGNKMDIEAILAGDEDAPSAISNKDDLMYIAITNPNIAVSYKTDVKLSSGGIVSQLVFNYKRALLRERRNAKLSGEAWSVDPGYSLSLNPIEGQTNLASQTILGLTKIDTTIRRCIKFVSDVIPDSCAIFLIRNKRFVCEKIEATIKPTGLDKLLTGYFYELKI